MKNIFLTFVGCIIQGFCRIGGGITVQPGPKNSWIFSGQFLERHTYY
jgi:hypothetical protein